MEVNDTDEIVALNAALDQAQWRIEQLKIAGNHLAAVLRSGSDCGWDRAIDIWEDVSNG